MTVGMNPAEAPKVGEEMYALIRRLYPICRSITGDGVRQSLGIVREYIPLEVHEVPTGTPVFDWTIPKEWKVREAYVKNARGDRVIDFQRHNLHLVGYSVPVRRRMPLEELKNHLFSLPQQPDWIPYRSSFYKETWGFCVTHNQLLALEDGEYEVVIDSTLAAGSLTYGEYYLPGSSTDEILLYSHICHPSLCNDNLTGIALLTFLARALAGQERRYSYRFVFAPTTIGSIAWLSLNQPHLNHIKHGLVVALVGDAGKPTYKKSRHGNAPIDRAALHVLKHSGQEFGVLDFSPYGYDERQFCSPGINLPVGRLTRTPNACFPEYHTSADDLKFVRPESLENSLGLCARIAYTLENDVRYVNLNPMGEPQLGKRGLFQKTSADRDVGSRDLALLWLLNLSDGQHTLLDIAERSGLAFEVIHSAAKDLMGCGLLRGDDRGYNNQVAPDEVTDHVPASCAPTPASSAKNPPID